MPKGERNNIEERLLYILVWAVVFLIPILNVFMLPFEKLHPLDLLLAWFKILPFFLIFLINTLYLLPQFALKGNYIIYIALLFAVVSSTFGIIEIFDSSLLLDEVYLVDAKGDKVTGSLLFTYLGFFWNSLLGLAMCSASYAIKLVYTSMRNQAAIAELNRRTAEAEMEQLKHQINPHFFMNTLNNIHALIDIDCEQAKGAIIELSKMFRHIVYHSDGNRITLPDEIKFVKSYIELAKLRFDSNLTIKFTHPDQVSMAKLCVPPLTLIIFIENAFKHGARGNSAAVIDIDISLRNNRVLYRVENNIAIKGSSKHGIGLENLRKRLDLLYKESYNLNIKHEPNRYIVELDIPINNEDKVRSNR